MKVLLINLVPPRGVWPRGEFRSYWVPTGVGHLAGVLKRLGHEVRLLNREEQLIKLRMDWDAADAALGQTLRQWRPDMVGFSVMTPAVGEARRLSELCRAELGNGAILVAGGAHPTVLPEQTLAECPAMDAAAIGEAEHTLAELADGARPVNVAGLVLRDSGAAVRTAQRRPVRDLDSLGLIPYELLDLEHYATANPWMIRWLNLRATNLRTARGCSSRCWFCGGHLVSGVGVRTHSIEYVIDRMRFAAEHMKVQAVHFEDDTLGADSRRLEDLCAAIRRSGLAGRLVWDGCLRVDQVRPELLAAMKASGCIQVELGFESGSQAGLAAIGKGSTRELNRRAVELVRQAGLRIFADIMIGLPGETRRDFGATVEFIRWAKPEVLSVARLCPLPGTWMYERLTPPQRQNLTWEGYAYMEQPGCNLTAMSDSKFERLCRRFNRYLVRPLTLDSMAADADDPARRARICRRIRRFRRRHPLRSLRLPWRYTRRSVTV